MNPDLTTRDLSRLTGCRRMTARLREVREANPRQSQARRRAARDFLRARAALDYSRLQLAGHRRRRLELSAL